MLSLSLSVSNLLFLLNFSDSDVLCRIASVCLPVFHVVNHPKLPPGIHKSQFNLLNLGN